MFSDHLRKIDDAPTKTLLLVAAGLVIFCQLVAMVMVADAQVEKAQLREASHASARAATAWCVQSSSGAALRDCDRTSSSLLSAQSGSDVAEQTPQGISLVTLSHPY
jgi:hypothetical protein